jgi:hypothetical protein
VAANPGNALRARLETRLGDAFEAALEALRGEGVDAADIPRPELPAPFLRLLLRALGELAPSDPRAELLMHYHLELLQRRRVVVLAGEGVQRALMHTPLRPEHMARLVSVLSRLFALLREAQVEPARLEVFQGAERAEDLVAGRTIADLFARTYYGGYSAPLYTSELDLLALDRELAVRPVLEVIDRRLAGPLLHELTHLDRGREALAPPYLDECVAAALGARAAPELVSPRVDSDGCDDAVALYGAGWFTQVGEHLIRALGLRPVIAAHAGLVPWAEVLPAGLATHFAHLGWEQHLASGHVAFLGEAQRPEAWIKALWLGMRGEIGHSLSELYALPWSAVPRPEADVVADAAFFGAASLALSARPRPTPEGAWRVVQEHGPEVMEAEAVLAVSPWDARHGPPFQWVFGPLGGHDAKG